MANWKDKVVLVTGGSDGLGRAIAFAFAQRGANVVIAARGMQKLAEAAVFLSGAGSQVLTVQADVTQQADVDAMIAQAVARFGRLDVLVNNAGRSARGAVLDTTPEEFRELMELNLISLVRCTRAAAPQLLAAGGSVVNIGSLSAKIASRFLGAYPASKFAVVAYSQQLRLELGPQGLHVLLVCPGPIARDEPHDYSKSTDMSQLPESARKPGGGVKVSRLRPESLAAEIVTACERRQPELIRPAKARLLFALSQLSPCLGDWIVRRMT